MQIGSGGFWLIRINTASSLENSENCIEYAYISILSRKQIRKHIYSHNLYQIVMYFTIDLAKYPKFSEKFKKYFAWFQDWG